MPLQPMGGGAAPPTALMSSPQKAAREGKKSPRQARWTKRPGQAFNSAETETICKKQELMTKPSTTIQRIGVDIADVPLHLIPMIYLEINASR